MTTTEKPTTHTAFRRASATTVQAIAGPLRRWRTRWGATDAEEAAATLPGDELIPQARWGYTHAITIDAPPEQVWPWLAQLGQGRGGFYSYEGLENLIGCHVRNVYPLVPECQNIVVGDQIRLHPQAPPLTVAMVEPHSRLVLHGALPESGDAQIWAFHLHRADHRRTRLIERGPRHVRAMPVQSARLRSHPDRARQLRHEPQNAPHDPPPRREQNPPRHPIAGSRGVPAASPEQSTPEGHRAGKTVRRQPIPVPMPSPCRSAPPIRPTPRKAHFRNAGRALPYRLRFASYISTRACPPARTKFTRAPPTGRALIVLRTARGSRLSAAVVNAASSSWARR